jgi:rhodanese-related sulfurtransferase
MRQYVVLVLALLLLLLLFLWGWNLQVPIHVGNKVYDLFLSTLLSHRVPEVSVERLDKMHFHILDARSYREFEVSHIPGATWVGYEEFSLDRLAGIDNQAPVAVYCSVGYRSERVAEQLQRQGYANVVNVYGGIFEWVNTKRPVVTDDGAETDEIHGYSKFWGFWLKRGTPIYD